MPELTDIAQSIEEAKRSKGIPEVLLKTINVLFLDVSSTCTGYTIAEFDISDKKAPVKITKSGVLWFNDEWDHPTKYAYIFNAILTYFEVVERIDLIIHEQYSVNKDAMNGVMVVPEMIGAIKVAAKENGVKIDSILPQTWRSQTGVKPIVTPNPKTGKNKRDYKTPCKDIMKDLFKNIPDTMVSNITNKNRATPSDLYDSMGVAIGWLKKNGYTNLVYNKCEYNTHIGAMN